MFFRRRRRRQPPILLPSLDALAELVERVVALLDQRGPAELVARSHYLPPPAGHVVFAAAPAGYRLLERDGAPPGRGEAIELDGSSFRVLRLGPSPLPGDPRRCVFAERVEREERPAPERTLDG